MHTLTNRDTPAARWQCTEQPMIWSELYSGFSQVSRAVVLEQGMADRWRGGLGRPSLTMTVSLAVAQAVPSPLSAMHWQQPASSSASWLMSRTPGLWLLTRLNDLMVWPFFSQCSTGGGSPELLHTNLAVFPRERDAVSGGCRITGGAV